MIRVAGGLDPGWSDRYGGLNNTEPGTTGNDGGPIVKLAGQAALCGVLNTLYDNRYPLL